MAEGVYVAVFSAVAEFYKRSVVTASTQRPAPTVAIPAVLVPTDTDLEQSETTEVDESKLDHDTKVVQEATHRAEVHMLNVHGIHITASDFENAQEVLSKVRAYIHYPNSATY